MCLWVSLQPLPCSSCHTYVKRNTETKPVLVAAVKTGSYVIKCVTEKVKVVCNSLAYVKYQHCTETLCNNAKITIIKP
jgi:hypothetical protein